MFLHEVAKLTGLMQEKPMLVQIRKNQKTIPSFCWY
jgi:hypothetical protein